MQSTKRRILVVEGNADAASSFSMLLDLLGNEVRTAEDGLAAIAVAETFRPEVIFLDVELPDLNGYDVCRAIRAQPWSAAVRIVALTGWSEKKHRRHVAEAGFDRTLLKPVEMEVLNDVLGTPLLT